MKIRNAPNYSDTSFIDSAKKSILRIMKEMRNLEPPTGFQLGRDPTVSTIKHSINGPNPTKRIRIFSQRILSLKREAILCGGRRKERRDSY